MHRALSDDVNNRSTTLLRAALAVVAIAGISGSALADAPGHDFGETEASAEPATTYSEIRFGIGGGGTTAGKNSEYDEEAVAAMNVAFLQRYGTKIVGLNLSVQDALFSATHTYVGANIGAVFGGTDAHMELIGEAGLHVITDLGEDLFSSARSDNTTAGMPYIGAQVRTVFDVGDHNGVQLELSVHARSDLSRGQRDIMVEGGLFSSTVERETWDLGGVTANAIAGLSYQFE